AAGIICMNPLGPRIVSMLSIIIPVCNDRFTLGPVLARICRTLPDVDKEIVIVDDRSTDGTREWLRKSFTGDSHAVSGIETDPSGHLVLTPPGSGPAVVVRLRYHEHNLGRGSALQTGFAAAT